MPVEREQMRLWMWMCYWRSRKLTLKSSLLKWLAELHKTQLPFQPWTEEPMCQDHKHPGEHCHLHTPGHHLGYRCRPGLAGYFRHSARKHSKFHHLEPEEHASGDAGDDGEIGQQRVNLLRPR